jgi:peptidoglycan/LPS O-acetylase OafA/YrhL
MTSQSDSSKRIPELDGLRGVAILSVLVYHYLEQQGPTPPHSLTHYAQRLVLMGWSGVDLFFVLSGFLIGGILLDARESHSYFSTFYLRRFFRIIPIYYLWIALYILVVMLASGFLLRHSNSGILPRPDFSVYAHFLFLQNIFLFPYGGVAGAWFSHLWSLAVEEQFYLVSPVLIRLLSGRSLKAFLFAVIAGAPLLRTYLRFDTAINRQLITASMPCRADSLAIGILAAVLWRSPSAREWLTSHLGALYGLLGACALGVAALWKWSPDSNTSGMQVAGLSCLALFYTTLLLLALAHTPGPVAALMRMGWLREAGRVSYCMYIIHLVVNDVLHTFLRHSPPSTTGAGPLLVTIAAGFVTYAAAWLSWHLIEHPLVRRGHAYKY